MSVKTTIKTASGSMSVEPLRIEGKVLLTMRMNGLTVAASELTVDQCGALIFGIEQALEALRVGKAVPA